MKYLSRLIIISLLIPSLSFAGDFSKKDKILFGSVCALQVIDGLTTANMLKNGSVITKDWAWKYGTNRPSSGRMWGIKALELGGAYVVAKQLPPKWRKGFFIAVDSLLFFCIQHNLRCGAGFTVNF